MSTTTANMSLKIPVSGDTDYAQSVSDSFNAIDTHDHSTGKGTQIITAGIANNAVTQAKRAALGHQISSSSGSFTAAAAVVPTDVTNLSVSITTTGRPIFLGLMADTSTGLTGEVGAQVTALATYDTATSVVITMVRASTTIYSQRALVTVNGSNLNIVTCPAGAFWVIDVPAAGTYTYKVQVNTGSVAHTAFVTNCKFIAYEL